MNKLKLIEELNGYSLVYYLLFNFVKHNLEDAVLPLDRREDPMQLYCY